MQRKRGKDKWKRERGKQNVDGEGINFSFYLIKEKTNCVEKVYKMF